MSRKTSSVIRLVIIPIVALGCVILAASQRGYSYSRLACFFALFVLAIDFASFAKGRWQNLLIVVATVFFGLGVVEAIGQVLMAHVAFAHQEGLFGDRAELGWGPTKAGAFHSEKVIDGKSVYKAVYTIDDDLLRRVQSNPKGPTIAFFGDSFTFGDGVNDPDTLPQKFSDAAPGLHVLNLAFSAYSPAQMLRELQVGLYDRLLLPSRLFVIQTGPYHAERTACKIHFSLRGPRYVSVDGDKVEYKGPCKSGIWRRLSEFYSETALDRVFVSPTMGRPTHQDVLTYIDIIGAIAKISRDKYHVPLFVFYVSPQTHLLDGTGFTDEDIRDRLRKVGAHLLDTDVYPEGNEVMRIPGDGHPTGAMNRLLAAKLLDDLKQTMPDVLKTH